MQIVKDTGSGLMQSGSGRVKEKRDNGWEKACGLTWRRSRDTVGG